MVGHDDEVGLVFAGHLEDFHVGDALAHDDFRPLETVEAREVELVDFFAHPGRMALDLRLVHAHALNGGDVHGVDDVELGLQFPGGLEREAEGVVGGVGEVGAEDDVREEVPAGGAGAVDDEHGALRLFRHGAHGVADDGAHPGGVGIARRAARAHDDEVGAQRAGEAQDFRGGHAHAHFHAEGLRAGFDLVGVGGVELLAHPLLIGLIGLFHVPAARIRDVGGEAARGHAVAMVERELRFLLFRQPESQLCGVVAAGRSRTRKQDVLEHGLTP